MLFNCGSGQVSRIVGTSQVLIIRKYKVSESSTNRGLEGTTAYKDPEFRLKGPIHMAAGIQTIPHANHTYFAA